MYLLLVFLSIIGSCLAGLFGRHLGSWGSAILTTSCLFLSFLISLLAFYEVALVGCFVYIKLSTWISSEVLNVDWGFMFDSLTVSMCVIVTFISFLVHLYSTEYMMHDPHLPRFMSYLSLFTFFMLILVTADNFLQMFVGWEGVGLCSYLLINFWFTRIQANKAAIKAMILNRIGDFSLLISILLIFIYYKAIDYATVATLTPFFKTITINFLNFKGDVLTIIGIFMFIGATGKSAQLFLHTWLPDAMEGERSLNSQIYKLNTTQVIDFFLIRESVIPVVRILRRSIYKNMLLLPAIYGMSCCYANLRITSDYPGIIRKILNKQRKNMCPSNELSFNKAFLFIRIKPFINYSNRVKYKIKRRFFSVEDGFKDLTFFRKFCRKTPIDVQSRVKSWIEKNAQLEKKLWTLYSNPNTKNCIFEIKNINKLKKLLKDYTYIQSVQVTEVLSISKTRIVQSNLPHSIEKLQCIFAESFCISVLAVLEISKLNGAKIPGVDKKSFSTFDCKRNEYLSRQLKRTRYYASGKSFKIKKDLPRKAILSYDLNESLKTQWINETINFRFKLLKQCNFKTIMKNYKGNSVRRVWVPRKDVNKYCFLDVFTIRDRILQQIIIWVLLPISELQADPFSFGFRPTKSATQAVVYVLNKLSKSKII